MVFKKLVWWILTPLLLLGFRVIPRNNTWAIDGSSAASSKLFIVYQNPTTALTNDFPRGDPLAGSGNVTIQQVMNSIITDYNNVAGAFVTLADNSDSDFSSRKDGRTITIQDGAAIGLASGGYAKATIKDGAIVGCEIVLNPEFFKSAKNLARGVTHEVGHCLGLNHPMDTVHSVMSYFYEGRPTIRLQIDDKMGLVYLYPVDPSGTREDATIGLSCSRR